MKFTSLKSLLAIFCLATTGMTATHALAAQDETLRQMTLKITQAKQKLSQAEAASGMEKQNLMAEHMKMMQENMEKMQAMKTKEGMSMQEQQEWMTQHQKMMSDMMGQMMAEHGMMSGMGCMNMGGDMHKHDASPTRSKSGADEHKH